MDVVVTVPKNFRCCGKVGLAAWIAEGDAAGEKWSGEEWHFYLGGYPPKIKPGERVYVVYNGKLRGYAPLVRVEENMGPQEHSEAAKNFGVPTATLRPKQPRGYALVRHGGAVAVTIDEHIPGFRGFRYRWWSLEAERPFPEWRTA